jgi:hypothetical protein
VDPKLARQLGDGSVALDRRAIAAVSGGGGVIAVISGVTRISRKGPMVCRLPAGESGFEPLVPLTLNQANAGEREEKIAMSPLRRIG